MGQLIGSPNRRFLALLNDTSSDSSTASFFAELKN
jgi:hypothetical protein